MTQGRSGQARKISPPPGFDSRNPPGRSQSLYRLIPAHILDAAACIKKREDKLRRTTRDLRTRVVKCGEVSGEVYRTFVVNCNKFDIETF